MHHFTIIYESSQHWSMTPWTLQNLDSGLWTRELDCGTGLHVDRTETWTDLWLSDDHFQLKCQLYTCLCYIISAGAVDLYYEC